MSQALMVLVGLAKVAYDWSRNTRKSTPFFDPKADENKDLITQFKESNGYDVTKGAVLASKITAAELKKEMETRKTLWEKLKTLSDGGNGSKEDVNRLIAWEYVFTKNGKLIEPEYQGATGHRRYFSCFEAFFRIVRDGDAKLIDKYANEYSMQVPVHVVEFASEAERTLKQIGENELRNVGAVNVNYLDNLKVINDLWAKGLVTQAQLRAEMGATSGQKYYHFLRLHNRYPELNLMERIQKPESESIESGRLSWSRLGSKFSDLVKISNSIDQTSVDEHNKRVQKEEQKIRVKTMEEINEDLRNLMREKSTNDPKMKSKDEIKALADGPNHVAGLVARTIYDPKNNGEAADRLGGMSASLNAINNLFNDKATYEPVEVFLSQLNAADEATRKHVLVQLAKIDFTVPVVKPARKGM